MEVIKNLFLQTQFLSGFVIVFLIIISLHYLLQYILAKLVDRFEKTKNYWDDAVINALRKPLSISIWIIGFAFIIHYYQSQLGQQMVGTINNIIDMVIIATISWFFLRFVNCIEKNIIDGKKEESSLDVTTVHAISKTINIIVVIVSVAVVMQLFGYSISGLLAFGGIGGLVVGLAAKDLLANFFGGLMIYLDRPFAVGDWVLSPDKQIEGTVSKVGWRQTEICTFQKRPLYVPNSLFTQIVVENPSRMTHRRIYETIGVRYDDTCKMGDIIKDVKQMLISHPEIDHHQTLIVNFNKFASSSLDFFIYTFTHTTNWIKYHEVKQDVLLRIIDIILEHDAQCAFPTSTLHIDGISAMPKVATDSLPPRG